MCKLYHYGKNNLKLRFWRNAFFYTNHWNHAPVFPDYVVFVLKISSRMFSSFLETDNFLIILAQSDILCFSLGKIIRLRNIVLLNCGWLNHGKGNNFFHGNTIFVSVVGYLRKGRFNKMSFICRSVRVLDCQCTWPKLSCRWGFSMNRNCTLMYYAFFDIYCHGSISKANPFVRMTNKEPYELQVSFIWNVDIPLQSGNSS